MKMRLSRIAYILLFNGWYIFYFYAVQPHLLARLATVPETRDVALGLFLLGFQLVEILGLWLKYPVAYHRIIESPKSSALGYFIVMISLLGHMGLITGLMSFATIHAFGIDLRGTGPVLPILLALLFMMAMLTKEGALLAFVLESQARKGPPPIPASPLNRHFPRVSAYLADVLLAIFGAVAYTVTWEQIVATSPFTAQTLGGRIGEYFGAVLFFILIFPATHPLSVAEEWLPQRPWKAHLFSVASFLVTMVAAISSIPN